MAITKLEYETVIKGFKTARIVLESVKPLVDSLNVIYDSGGGVKETLTQAELDGQADFSGLTKQQLDDGMYALTATLRTDIANAVTQLAQLSARAG